MIRAAVLGSPISHSLSPALHNAAYKHLGIAGNYSAIEVTNEQLSQFVRDADSSWTGFSLTMPLKEEVLSIADEVEELAAQIDSANTLIRTPQGWRASTTDVNGFRQALKFHGVSDWKHSVIIGSGATARAAAAALDGPGRLISVIHRNPQRCESMLKAAPLSEVIFLEWESNLPMADITINTTPAFVADSFVGRLPKSVGGLFFEALYNPWPTSILAAWRDGGGAVIDGLDLLVHQAIDQIALMSGLPIDREEYVPILRKAGLAALNF